MRGLASLKTLGWGADEVPTATDGSEHGREDSLTLGDFHIKKIILPSGKAVEIVYFDAEGRREDDDRAVRQAFDLSGPATPVDAPSTLECCPACTGTLVYPVDWHEAEGDAWELELRCPSCEWTHRDVYDQDTVERFDAILNDATDELIGTLEEVSRDNLREEIERFVAALDADLILPFDF
jgi:hypothetical protein